ncbi:MAG TPA: hypothetical protein VF637_00485, partial [Sphingomicrobium sp.]
MPLRTVSGATLAAMLVVSPAVAQQQPGLLPANDPTGADIIVSAQRNNATEIERAGQVGILGDKAAADVPFS